MLKLPLSSIATLAHPWLTRARDHDSYTRKFKFDAGGSPLLAGFALPLSASDSLRGAAARARTKFARNSHAPFGRGSFCRRGTRAALFGNESGRMEAWVYPLKFLRDFRLQFQRTAGYSGGDTGTHGARAAGILRQSLTPAILSGSGDTFRPGERIWSGNFARCRDRGAPGDRNKYSCGFSAGVAGFDRRQPSSRWDARLNAFSFGEESKKYAGFIGSPTRPSGER